MISKLEESYFNVFLSIVIMDSHNLVEYKFQYVKK